MELFIAVLKGLSNREHVIELNVVYRLNEGVGKARGDVITQGTDTDKDHNKEEGKGLRVGKEGVAGKGQAQDVAILQLDGVVVSFFVQGIGVAQGVPLSIGDGGSDLLTSEVVVHMVFVGHIVKDHGTVRGDQCDAIGIGL